MRTKQLMYNYMISPSPTTYQTIRYVTPYNRHCEAAVTSSLQDDVSSAEMVVQIRESAVSVRQAKRAGKGARARLLARD